MRVRLSRPTRARAGSHAFSSTSSCPTISRSGSVMLLSILNTILQDRYYETVSEVTKADLDP